MLLQHWGTVVSRNIKQSLSQSHHITLMLLLLTTALTACGGGGSGGSSNTPNTPGNINDITAPQFDGFALAVSSDPAEASLAWIPANDNVTPPNDIEYELYYSTDANFTPGPASLFDTYTGEISAIVDTLTPATAYYFKITAIDTAGNSTHAEDSITVTTATTSAVRTTTPTQNAEDLNLGTPQIDSLDSSLYIYTKTAASTAPDIGSVIIGGDSEGNGYIKRVNTVTQDATTITVGTSEANLSDVLETAEISSEVVLRSTEQETQAASQLLGNLHSSVINSKHKPRQKLVWKDKLLTIIEDQDTQPLTKPNVALISSTHNQSRTTKSTINVSASNSLTLTGTIGFEPTMKADVEMSLFSVASANVQLSGTLSADLTLNYKYNGSASINESQNLFDRTYISRYLVGNVPVYQETTLTITAHFTGNATTAIEAESQATASSTLTVGANYDGSTWTPTTSESFDYNLTVNANAHGTATAQVRLIPEVKVKFYKAASALITVEPYTRAEVAAQAVAEASLVNNNFMGSYGFTQFNAFMGVDVNMMADLKIFAITVARYPETGRKNLFHEETQLFGLPTIDEAVMEGIPNINDNASIRMNATVTPFENEFGLINAFDEASANWVIFPSLEEVGGISGTWSPPSHGSVYTAYFIGNSEMLGEIGRQYVEVTFTLPESTEPAVLDMRDDDSDGMPNTWETFYGLDPTVYNATEDPDADDVSNVDEYTAVTKPIGDIFCTERGYAAEGVSTKIDTEGNTWIANCAGNLLTDYPPTHITDPAPKYALIRKGVVKDTEFSYSNGNYNKRVIVTHHYSHGSAMAKASHYAPREDVSVLWVLDGPGAGWYKSGALKYTHEFRDGNGCGFTVFHFDSLDANTVGETKLSSWAGACDTSIDHQIVRNNGFEYQYYTSGALRYELPIIDGTIQGTAKLFYDYPETHVEFEYQFVDGLIQGTARQYLFDGTLYNDAPYVNNLRQGNHIYYFHVSEGGGVRSRLPFVDDLLHGNAKNYHPGGQTQQDANYVNGHRDGSSTDYFESGAIHDSGQYSEGVKTGTWLTYFIDGLVQEKITYNDGKAHGTYELYHFTGTLLESGQYDNARKSGTWSYYDIDGNLTNTVTCPCE